MNEIPRIAWVALGGVVALVLLIVLTNPKPPVESTGVAVAPTAGGSVTIRRVTVDPRPARPVVRALDAYARLSHRNLFHPLIRSGADPAVGEAPGVQPATIFGLPPAGGSLDPMAGLGGGTPQDSFGKWLYLGFVLEDGRPEAMLEESTEHHGLLVKAGDQVDGAAVLAVSRDSVRLLKDGKPILLQLTNGADAGKKAGTGGAKGAPAAANAPGGPPQGAAPGGAAPGGAPHGPPPSGGPPQPSPPPGPQPGRAAPAVRMEVAPPGPMK